MTRVKICGITNLEDALHAVRCGADALGFIHVPDTPRYVHAHEGAAAIVDKLPPFVNRVAVFKDLAEIDSRRAGSYDSIQYYEDSGGFEGAGKTLIRAIRLQSEPDLDHLQEIELTADAILIDSFHPDRLGGTGVTADWNLAAEARNRLTKPLILSGGLTPQNVRDALAIVRPYGVDVSSGVESEPGRKDPLTVRRFIEAVRKFDTSWDE